MKGLILAGGHGTRLYPLTKAISKQLLPVFDKPMIYYPLSALMLAGVREIAVIASPEQLTNFQILLGDGSRFGIELSYIVQKEPRGLADAYIVASGYLGGESSVMILGDNLFYGVGLGQSLEVHSQVVYGARVFGARVSDPTSYGILKLDSTGNVVSIVEKPEQYVGDIAIPGLYFFDGTASDRARAQVPSKRGELEIVDLMNSYLENGKLEYSLLARGTVWLDMGTPSGLAEAGEFVRIVQRRQQTLIACLEEIALRLGYLSEEQLATIVADTPSGSYRSYLESLLN
jgi:glucose-1-phosphate thymidylyltransferase